MEDVRIEKGHKRQGYGAKAAMTLRLAENATDGMVMVGDSDFGSLPAAFGLAKKNIGCIFNVKTAYGGTPKLKAESILKGCRAGTSMVFTTEIGGIRFNFIAYKYARSKKVQFFITTVGEVVSKRYPYIV